MKYILKHSSYSEAISNTIPSPTVSLIKDFQDEKLLMGKTENDEPIQIFGADVESAKITPVDPYADYKIYYTTDDGVKYPIQEYINQLTSAGLDYIGPRIISNDIDENTGMYCIICEEPITMLGMDNIWNPKEFSICFVTNSSYQLDCKISSIILPKSIEEIGSGAFYGTSYLKTVSIPASIGIIGEGAFWNSGISYISIPSTTEIEEVSFASCQNLKKLCLLEGFEIVPDEAFNGTNLDYVEFPKSLKRIGWAAFSCPKEVICKAEVPPLLDRDGDSGGFNFNSSIIRVPKQSLNAYKTDQYWSQYAEQIFAL